ncbi:hypothetical protein K435DRAFT_819510 [Dendrothele bispora CBS 962.96]|uniref:Transposase domain-containing protein n=1 Tax=Dendrothele bispora (strain CBS 962.96) TaxID=1314807 RepID=A0A4S8M262_DENBC|nr:hypothetical protein K435DRAFT_819510 [Dendrothele bispora CBS 962.96]
MHTSVAPILGLTVHSVLLQLYTLVVWLHTHFHVPFLACNVVLFVVSNIVKAVDPSIIAPPVTFYSTLPTVLNHMGVEPDFQVLPVCPSCLKPYPASTTSCSICDAPLFRFIQSLNRRNSAGANSNPFLQFPMKSIESQLREILLVPGMEDLLEQWRDVSRVDGEYQDIFDGAICKELKGVDGRLFFANPLPDESNIAFLLSDVLQSHQLALTSPVSIHTISYRTSNIILTGIMPGPKEQTGDQVQQFMHIFVNELLRLWRYGFWVKTKKYPAGRRVHVILVCVICDKPAAHKLGGFASHSHTFFCHRCWIKQADKSSEQAFHANAFPSRTHDEHVRYGREYQKCDTETARKDFVKKFATRWSELCRLPYFDLCRMIVIDPMHNLILGIVKTHFYHIWIQCKILRKRHELLRFHQMLSKIQVPAYLGRLPALMGEPAGGSLTADQWLIAATVICPLIIPQLWNEYCVDDDAESVRLKRIGDIQKAIDERKAKAAAARKAKEAAKAKAAADARASRPRRKRTRTARAQFVDEDPEANEITDDGAKEQEHDIYMDGAAGSDDDDDGESRTAPKLHPEDPANFFKLSSALKLLLSRKLYSSDILEFERLIRDYNCELIRLYGKNVLRPNHHYAIHIADCVRDFGPLRGFWTFLFERINKVLKSYNSANHSSGELETSFFREFHRTVQQARVMNLMHANSDHLLQESIEAMYHVAADNRGTVQELSRELDQQNPDDGVTFTFSTRYERKDMEPDLYKLVLQHVQTVCILPFPLISHLDPTPNGIPLLPSAFFFDYAVVMQKRYWSSVRARNTANSIIATTSQDGTIHVGELLHIIGFQQEGIGIHRYGVVRWFCPANIEIATTPWSYA